MIENRKQKEIDFHNNREKDRNILSEEEYLKKYSNKKFYSVVRKSTDYIDEWMTKHCNGKTVLDYCCGLGDTSLRLAKHGAIVYGIDISSESIKTSKENLIDAGLEKVSHFEVMDAENTKFEDNFFDFIICNGVLHHLDINKAFAELSRILKPNGKIICIEALGYNPIINLYRKRTLHLRTKWESEHILTLKEVNMAKNYFKNVSVIFFHFFTIAAIPFREQVFFKPLLSFLEFLDSILLKIPFIQFMAWQMIFELEHPSIKQKC